MNPRIHATGRGFTLVELIVVLAILAVLATMTLTVTSGMNDQIRREKTVQVMDGIERAIFGELRGTNEAYGFVQDLGVFPPSFTELLQKGNYPNPTLDENSGLVAGWNGPYLQLGDNEGEIKDGWGNPLVLVNDGNTLTIRSYGRDGKPGGTGFDADLERVYYKNGEPNHGTALYGIVHYTIEHAAGSEAKKITISIVQPKDGVIQESEIEVVGSMQPGDPEVTGTIVFDDHLTCGVRAIKLYYEIDQTSYARYRPVRVVAGGTSMVAFTITE